MSSLDERYWAGLVSVAPAASSAECPADASSVQSRAHTVTGVVVRGGAHDNAMPARTPRAIHPSGRCRCRKHPGPPFLAHNDDAPRGLGSDPAAGGGRGAQPRKDRALRCDASAVEVVDRRDGQAGSHGGVARRRQISSQTYNESAATRTETLGHVGLRECLPLPLPLNSAIPGGRGGHSGYAYPL